MRPSEKNGVDYFFIEEKDFIHMIKDCAFLEHAQVFNHFYGTSMQQINARLEQGIDVVLDIDWQGAEQIRRSFPNAVSIFIIPPSLDVLNQRLLDRRQDKDEVISERMKKAQDELSHYSEFDYLIVNENFEKAAMELGAIVIANRLGIKRQINKQSKLLSFLLSSQ
jgi:guanylate kinase